MTAALCPLPPTVEELRQAFLDRVPDGLVIDSNWARPGRARRSSVPVLTLGRPGRRRVRRRARGRIGAPTVDGLARDRRGPRPFTLSFPAPDPGSVRPPEDFRVAAVLAVRNEADILGWVVDQLLDAEECCVYVIDNHSTDSTQALLRGRMDHPRFLGWERWPSVPDSQFDWAGLLQRKAQVAASLDAVTWVLHSDADEVRRSPWTGTSLRQGLWLVESWGATLVDFTVVNHLPVDGHSPEARTDIDRLDHVELGLRPGYFLQRKCWRRPDDGTFVSLSGGGHRPDHPDPRVFPLNFRVDHYPVRSQAHGEQKILRDLRARAMAEQASRGWHVHYDHVVSGHRFARPAGSLPRDDDHFATAQAGRLLLRAGMEPDPDFAIV